MPYSVLHRWRKKSQDYGKNSFPGRGKPKLTDEQKEIALLKHQLKDVSQENEILKKASTAPSTGISIKRHTVPLLSVLSKSDKKILGL